MGLCLLWYRGILAGRACTSGSTLIPGEKLYERIMLALSSSPYRNDFED